MSLPPPDPWQHPRPGRAAPPAQRLSSGQRAEPQGSRRHQHYNSSISHYPPPLPHSSSTAAGICFTAWACAVCRGAWASAPCSPRSLNPPTSTSPQRLGTRTLPPLGCLQFEHGLSVSREARIHQPWRAPELELARVIHIPKPKCLDRAAHTFPKLRLQAQLLSF